MSQIKINDGYKIFCVVLIAIILVNPISLYILANSLFFSLSIAIINIIFLIVFFRMVKHVLFYGYFILNIIFFTIVNAEIIFVNNFNNYRINNFYEFKSNYYFNKPNLNKIIDDIEYQTIYQTDNRGYRIGHLHETLNNVEWLFIGDSYTQGAQVNFEELYTSYLKDFYSSINICNAGISGFGISEEYEYYINEGFQFKPKKVFLQLSVLNDFENIGLKKVDLTDILMNYSELGRFVLFKTKFKNNVELPLGRWVEPFFQHEVDNINYNILYKKSSKIKDENINNLKTYLIKLSNEVKKNDAELILILIPTKEQVYKKFYNEVINKFSIEEKFIDIHKASEIIRDISVKQNIQFIDPLEEFIKEPEMLYFEKDEHLNSKGHRKLAKIVYDFLKKEPLLQ